MILLTIPWLTVLLATGLYAQNPVPAPAQSKRILLMGGIVHTATGKVINNSAIGFEGGKLKLVADITTIRIDRTQYDTVIDISGKHVYPGLIALNTVIGLREIEAVRATSDYVETGSFNPSARSLIAYNTDSKVTPTVRANGILLAQVVPQGGLLSGQSSVVELDAWNYEDAAYKADIGLHLNWPSMRVIRSRRAEPEEKQLERTEKALKELRQFFADAKAYASLAAPENRNLHFEAMRGLFSGTKRLFVHCNFVREIISAAGFCREMGISMVLVGGADSWMVTELLSDSKIPVVLTDIHRLPTREDEAVDMPYRLPYFLRQAGVQFAIASNGFWQIRNLPFQAGTAGGYGLDREAMLQSVTADAASILGIDGTTGTLEPGKDATLVICTGDLFDTKSAAVVGAFIRGREISLDSVQEQLYRKYLGKYGLGE
jgi:imidazolonepropionase-like amidohydrolase